MTQRMIHIDSPLLVREPELQAGGPAGLFPAPAPLALEIGCGIGDFVVQIARQQPQYNFLAIDIYNKGCLKTCRRVEKAGLANVRVMRIEARYLLANHLAPESLAAVYINCPDPWPKKRHRDRRLVNPEFARTLLYYLEPAGDLYFSTDFADYAEQVAELMPEQPGYVNQLDAPLQHELPGYPLSKYLRRFLDQGKPVHFIHYRKRAGLPPEQIMLPSVGRGFRTDWSRAGHE